MSLGVSIWILPFLQCFWQGFSKGNYKICNEKSRIIFIESRLQDYVIKRPIIHLDGLSTHMTYQKRYIRY